MQADGSLPDLALFRLVEGSDLIDGGTDLGYAFLGQAPDLGAFEYDDGTTAIDGLTTPEFSIQLLQNPVINVLRLSIEADKSSSANLKLIAVTGSIIYNETLNIQQGQQFKEIGLGGVESGLYLLQLSSANAVSCVRFIVKK